MAKTVKGCMKLLLKLVNSTMGIVGISMVLYGLWMIRVWERDTADSSSDYYGSTFPWFIHAFLGIGVSLCAITCLGHISADTAHSFCLSFYMVTIFLLLLLETAMIADVCLNSDWEKDLPDDPSGRFNDFKDFVNSNIDVCKWISLLIVLAQGCSILLATVLRTIRTDKGSFYESDIEYAQPRVPLLNHPSLPLPSYVVGEPQFGYANESWKPGKQVNAVLRAATNAKNISIHLNSALKYEQRELW